MTEQRSVLVTGGSRGVGQGIVESFLAAGDRVATCSRSPSPAVESWTDDAALKDSFYFEAVDLADASTHREFIARVAERLGGIDVLVNNAGIARDGVLGLMPDEDVDAVIDLNLRSTIRFTKHVVRKMLHQGHGRVITISSIVGLSGYRGLSAYSATKAGLDGFTRALARELGPRHITVNSVAPGYLETEMSHGLDADQLGQISRRTPLGRLGTPEDVAGAVEFLASPAAGFITGQVLVVDGGLSA
jgi:3-oxoacyl-[acyl-carrier protein] reductase